MVGIGIETRKMMRTQGRIRPVQTLSSTFSVFEASLVLERRWWQSVLIAFPRWKGDGCMKDTDHPIRHPRVHLAFEQLPEGEAVAHGETVSLAAEWHRVGLERPHFCTRFPGQSDSWVAPAHKEIRSGVLPRYLAGF